MFIALPSTVFLLWILGKKFIQWVKIDSKYVIYKCLWGTIKKYRWSDIKEIYIESLPVSHPNTFMIKWFVIDDGNGESLRNAFGYQIRINCIKLIYSKRALKVMQMYWGKDIETR